MDISISDVTTTTPAPPSPAPPVHPNQHAVQPDDTVKLSESQQVQALVQQGDSVAQIASSLSLTASLVESYLGIQATVPAPSPAPQPQAQSISVSATSGVTNG